MPALVAKLTPAREAHAQAALLAQAEPELVVPRWAPAAVEPAEPRQAEPRLAEPRLVAPRLVAPQLVAPRPAEPAV
jgi:hypothetical protein